MPLLTILLVILCVGSLTLAGIALASTRHARRRQKEEERRAAASQKDVEHLRNRLAQAQRMEAVGVFAGSIIHNLNNLLAVILGHARLASQASSRETRCQEELGKVLNAGTLAGNLVKDLSDFYRQADLSRKPTELLPIVRDTVKLMKDILPGSIEILTDLEPCGPVLASATGVQQVLMNLFSNSVQAMLRGEGKITVTLKEESITGRRRALPHDLDPGSYVCLAIQDTGRGMDQSTLDRITENYYGQDPATGQQGLGLATVCRILDQHQGATIPRSKVGNGTTFSLYFPLIAWSVPSLPTQLSASQDEPILMEDQLELPTPSPTPHTAALTEGLRVLLVDDEDMVAEVMSRGLTRLGFSVTTLTDSVSALELFRDNPRAFDIVVTDQIMPHMSGVRLAQEIRQIKPGMPVILTTGFRDSFHELQARESGVQEFILKPCSHHDLANLIARLTQKAMEGGA